MNTISLLLWLASDEGNDFYGGIVWIILVNKLHEGTLLPIMLFGFVLSFVMVGGSFHLPLTLAELVEKLLGMGPNLGAWSSSNEFLHFLPILAVGGDG